MFLSLDIELASLFLAVVNDFISGILIESNQLLPICYFLWASNVLEQACVCVQGRI